MLRAITCNNHREEVSHELSLRKYYVCPSSPPARNNKEILFALTRPYLEALNRDIFRVRQSEEGLKGKRKVLRGANFANFLKL